MWLSSVTAYAGDDRVSPKREVPDYDGRGAPPVTATDVALVPVRLVLSPLYIVSEMIRQPIGGLVIAAERAELPRKAYDFFAFGPDHSIGIVPVGFVAFGLNPSVGLYSFWNDALVPGHDMRLHLEAWPTDWYSATLTDRWRLDAERDTLQLRGVAVQRPDEPFYGIGPASRQADQSRYAEVRGEGQLSLQVHGWRASSIVAAVGARGVKVSAGHFDNDPSIDVRARMGAFELPVGFGGSYAGPTGRLYAALDTRESESAVESGVRVEAQTSGGSDLASGNAWLRYGAVASGMLDLDGHGRLVDVSIAGLFADPTSSAPMPFTELVTLGGEIWMTGYLPGRLVDRSAAVAALDYRWPIAAAVDATLHAAVGNVFGPHLDGFDMGLLRFSGGLGITTRSDPPLEIIIGFGTDTFDAGGTVQSGRISFGVPQHF